MKNSSIFEINTRVWLNRYRLGNNKAKISDVPDFYWEKLKNLGIDYVWLMGIWEISKNSIPKYCFTEHLLTEYKNALLEFKEEDVIGSPFAIVNYEINPLISTKDDLVELRDKLKRYNLKLILDFIPNHFSAESNLIKSNPELFVQITVEEFQKDSKSYFKDPIGRNIYFAHGRDPFFPAWTDTVQLNYRNRATREFMTNKLLEISDFCDGVRCDMSMLILNEIFNNTWAAKSKETGDENIESEYWETAIAKVKENRPEFIFIAEAYWDLEWRLQQLGFDFTYDKKLTDRLVAGDVQLIHEHLKAAPEYQIKSVRFIENHDEERAVTSMGVEKSKAAAVIISCLPGLRFYYDGQFEGRKIKLPVQLGREPVESINSELANFYKKLLNITKSEIFKQGEWEIIKPTRAGEEDLTFTNIFAIEWILGKERRLAVINYSNNTSYCRISININKYNEDVRFIDLLNDTKYTRSQSEIIREGLFIKLKSYCSHIFAY